MAKKSYIAVKDFNSLGNKKSYKRGKAVSAPEQYLNEWLRLGFIKEGTEVKTKEEKGKTDTK